MSSRSATVLVIFTVAIIAFCLACVCASITGPISILPSESNSGSILDNLSAITDGTGNNGESYGYQDYNDYSSSDSGSSYSDDSNVETTTDSSSSSSGSHPSSSSTSSSSSTTTVETTTETSTSTSTSSSSDVETTVAED